MNSLRSGSNLTHRTIASSSCHTISLTHTSKLISGSFAVVKRATRKSDGKQFAIKVIKKSKLNSEELAVVHDEVEIMHKINHPNCVQLYEMFETSKKMYMVRPKRVEGESVRIEGDWYLDRSRVFILCVFYLCSASSYSLFCNLRFLSS